MRVILASASPRRSELLGLIFSDFEVIPADIDESIYSDEPIERISLLLAEKKALKAAQGLSDALVIGSDTTVQIDGKILGKPVDNADCFNMLKALSGRTHKVVTGVALCLNGRIHSFSETTEVSFYEISDSEINKYIRSDEPFDKAGGYGIQGLGSLMVEKINGDYFNVVGLPVSRLKREIDVFCGSTADEVMP